MLSEELEKCLKVVADYPLIAYDTETSGLDWKINYPVGHVITASPELNFYVPIRHAGGMNIPGPAGTLDGPTYTQLVPHPFEVELAKAFAEREKKSLITVGHNVKFDCHMALNVGVRLGRNIRDTSIIQALLNEYTKKWSLDEISKLYGVTPKLGEDLYKHMARLFGGPPDRSQMQHFWRLPGHDALGVEYAKGDGITTLELYNKQMREIRDEGLEYICDELEGPLTWTLVRMERVGIPVDVTAAESTTEAIDDHIEQAASRLPDGFNSRSPVQMRELMTNLGRLDWPVTEKGNPSFNEHWLKTFEEGRAILEHRQWNNLKNTFLGPLINEHCFKGRVHANINQLKGDDFGTVSGRLSCSSPNLQQIPKRNKPVAKVLRKLFVPDEGYTFYERDYSQCEPRLFTHYSKEPRLVEGYTSDPPSDMHQVVAEMLDVERDPTAKRMNMGILTGMYPKAFAGHMGWSIEEATYKWNQWFEAFPLIRNFQDTASSVFKRRGYVKTLLGRRCRLEHNRFAYRAVSRIIQGGNADVLKKKMLEVDRFLEDGGDVGNLFMTVHDSFVYQLPKGKQGDEMDAEIARIMEDVRSAPINLSVPFVTDLGKGNNWAEATFG